jgi:glycosyltransferase involved in cell wall biosynthesis
MKTPRNQSKSFRVLFFGDTNNNFITLARFLRREGIDAKVVPTLSISRGALYRVYDLMRSREDFLCLELANISDILVLEKPFKYRSQRVREALQGLLTSDCRVVSVGSGLAPAIFEYAGLKLDITFATGADVRYFPFYNSISSISRGFGVSLKDNIIKNIKQNSEMKSRSDILRFRTLADTRTWYNIISSIRQEFKKLKNLPGFQYHMYVDTWKSPDNLRLKRIALPMEDDRIRDLSLYDPDSKGIFVDLANKLRSRYDFIVLSTSQNTKSKGTDILLRGFLQFKTLNPDMKALLIISARPDLLWLSRGVERNFEDGLSKEDIFLLPLIPQKELDVFYNISDVAFGKISSDKYHLNGTISKILAHGKPMINFISEEYKKRIVDVYPYFSAKNEDEVARVLGELCRNRVLLDSCGSHVSEWYRNFTRSSVRSWIALFHETVHQELHS